MRFWRNWSLPAALAAALVVIGMSVGPAAARTLCVGKDSILLRAGPSWRENPVGSLPGGSCGLQVIGECVKGWCQVSLGSRRGWVDARQVIVHEGKEAPAAPSRAEQPRQRQAEPAPPPRQAEPRPAPPSTTGTAADRGSHCVQGVRRGDTLRVRTGPSVEYDEVGGIPPNACGVMISGPCRGSWCPVIYRGLRGWSNASYLRPPWMR
jgi:uncharacterized protein YraI